MIEIITVNYNDKLGLERTLQSIRSQTESCVLSIIDGGSSDGSDTVINSNSDLVTRYISEPDSGIYNAMNKGVKFASEDYIIFMNSGDTFVDEHTLSNIKNEISNKPDVDIYYSDAIYIRGNSEFIHHAEHSLILSKMPFNHQSTVIKRSLHVKIPYNENYRISSDYDFFLRASRRDVIFHKLKTKIARHSLDGISVLSPFHSCLESVHSHLMNFKNIKFEETEYYGEFFIKEIFKSKPFLSRSVVALYTIFVKGHKIRMLKLLLGKVFR
ncbi:glycosyltransferase family 2 protein [Grimontia sp. AD028]|uniref:glycosyltransferase family 2 protein n=1 Tax=Grimontia sp. AD028 TaxID=1581149 RepID=UPI0006969423|nr:glycosyltransferase family 2 protein [Grimontia sp. AD028]